MIDFDKRLASLKDRRQGTKEINIVESMDSTLANIAIAGGLDYRDKEYFELIKESSAIKYAVGAMASVDNKYTAVSIDEGERVAKSLQTSLKQQGVSVTYRMQGSVALDIHIKGHSDVDMLILLDGWVIVEKPYVKPGFYSGAKPDKPIIDMVKEIRLKSEEILPKNFPAANIKKNKPKCIEISEGSLRRSVDVVPSCWHDNIVYQKTLSESDRGVNIYNKEEHSFINNLPFKHIKLINEKDAVYGGNLKSAIRLLKNLIADMPDDKKGKAKKLSSFDLAAVCYHMNDALVTLPYFQLALVESMRDYIFTLLNSHMHRKSLKVPDESRYIFDSDEKDDALEVIYNELNDLALSIFKELSPHLAEYDRNVILNKKLVF